MAKAAVLLALLLAAVALAACGDEEPGGAAREPMLRVTASFAPLEEIARAVGGERARVTGLTPPGQGPHDLELRAPQLRALERADLVLFLGAGFQPAVEEAVGALADDVTKADLLGAVRLREVDDPVRGVRGEVDGEVVRGDRDPHVWVDPVLFGRLVDEAERAFAAADPEGARAYARNADAYRARIAELDRAFAEGLRDCATRTLVTSHAAFGYLADRYDLEQAPIAGISPDDEPDPRSLEATARRARADGVRTVFFESLVPRDLAETVAREIGARTDMLDPVEGLSREDLDAGRGYVDVQRENLARLREGLACTG
jgi:zinc transport system substrate-binding protein